MGIREPGALTKAIDQLRIDLAESDTETRVAYADADALLVVLETAREVARQELVVEWLEFFRSTDHRTANETAVDLLAAIASMEAPFEHGMPPKEAEESDVCAAFSYDGKLACQLSEGHTDDHRSETPEGAVRWARMCKAAFPEAMPDGTAGWCDLDAGHEDGHYDSAQGVSW